MARVATNAAYGVSPAPPVRSEAYGAPLLDEDYSTDSSTHGIVLYNGLEDGDSGWTATTDSEF